MTPHHIQLKRAADLEGFRVAVRRLIGASVHPRDVVWTSSESPELFESVPIVKADPIVLPRPALALIDAVVCHRDAERYALLYSLIWRLRHGERDVLDFHSDPLVNTLAKMQKSVARDLHKMHAFLRFRRAADTSQGERFVAWFEPDHFILEACSSFFVERFGSFAWSILTPMGSLHWDRNRIVYGPPACKRDTPAKDGFDEAWISYYESTFNPARLNTKAMRAHMPKKYWRNLPEVAALPELIQTAPNRVAEMIERQTATPRKRNPDKALAAIWDQEPKTLTALNTIISASEPFVPGATRAVLGEGPLGAAIAFVGEQPGDHEDRQGRPFVGPAGQLLDRALAEAGIDRKRCYLTNAVKHFKFEQRGKRRLHRTPTAGEVKHYRWWLQKELDLVRPRIVVALGATAVLALTGKSLPIVRIRGPAEFGFITVHPAYLLRLPDELPRVQAYRDFVRDLAWVGRLACAPRRLPGTPSP